MSAILMIDENTFKLTARGSEMTLEREGDRWVMYTVNASVRAWNNGFATPKFFASLEEVEANYKSWKGVSKLIS